MKIFKHIADLWSLVVGLLITGKYFFCKKPTVYYPRQVIEPERTRDFRGPIELVGTDADPRLPRCIGCMLCVQACPNNCIRIEKAKPAKPTPEEIQAMKEAAERGEKAGRAAASGASKVPAVWDYDYSLCCLCGACVETCPVKSIAFSHEIYLASQNREDFHLDLLARLRRKGGQLCSGCPNSDSQGRQPGQAGTKQAAAQTARDERATGKNNAEARG